MDIYYIYIHNSREFLFRELPNGISNLNTTHPIPLHISPPGHLTEVDTNILLSSFRNSRFSFFSSACSSRSACWLCVKYRRLYPTLAHFARWTSFIIHEHRTYKSEAPQWTPNTHRPKKKPTRGRCCRCIFGEDLTARPTSNTQTDAAQMPPNTMMPTTKKPSLQGSPNAFAGASLRITLL